MFTRIFVYQTMVKYLIRASVISVLSVFAQISYSQTRFGVYIVPGVNTVIYRGDFPAESYWPKPGFSTGGFADIRLFKSNFSLQPGIQYSNRSFDVHYNRQSRTEIINSLEAPVAFQYSFKNRFNPRVGFINSFNFGQNEHINPYSLGLIAGLDFIIWKHLILGCEFTCDIGPVMTEEATDVNYYRYFGGIRLGYLF